MLKLDLGAGGGQIEGFTPLDIKDGQQVYPLAYADNSVDEIRASHVLEHFPYEDTILVVKEWVRALKPGGWLRIAVPDFEYLIDAHRKGEQVAVEGILMGGHQDEHDHHKAIFTQGKLEAILRNCGLEDIQGWLSEITDCATKASSLNLKGRKPEAQTGTDFVRGKTVMIPSNAPKLPLKVAACMTVPRLGFQDFFNCVFQALAPWKIPLQMSRGVFWGANMTRAMTAVLESERPDVLLALDYDTVFTQQDIVDLVGTMAEHPEADALCAMESHRCKDTPLLTVKGGDGKNVEQVAYEELAKPLMKLATAHFGFTLIRVDRLKQVPHPWFKGEPGPSGLWDDNRTDEDIWFWRNWEKAGFSLYQANRVVVGHAELMVRWPGKDLQVMYQHPFEFWQRYSKPEGAWK